MQRELRGIAIALLLIAATTAVAVVLRQYLGILRGSVLYLVPVMLAGYHLGVVPALVTAVAGVILSGYLYFAQLYSFKVASPQEALNLVLYMVVAVVVSHLANSAKRHTTIARKREREMSDLYAFSRRLAAAPSAAEIFVAIQNHLANLVQRKVVLLGAADAGNAEDVPERVRAEVDARRARRRARTHDRRRQGQHLAHSPRLAENAGFRQRRRRSRQRLGRGARRHAPAHRRRARRRRGHTRAARRRARAQRSEDALGDRAACARR